MPKLPSFEDSEGSIEIKKMPSERDILEVGKDATKTALMEEVRQMSSTKKPPGSVKLRVTDVDESETYLPVKDFRRKMNKSTVHNNTVGRILDQLAPGVEG